MIRHGVIPLSPLDRAGRVVLSSLVVRDLSEQEQVKVVLVCAPISLDIANSQADPASPVIHNSIMVQKADDDSRVIH